MSDLDRPAELMPEMVGARLREERIRLCLSQDKAGELGGVRRTTVYQYEKGDRYPSMDYLCNLASATEFDMFYVINGDRRVLPNPDDQWVSAELLSAFFILVDRHAVDEFGNSLDHDERSALFNKMVDLATNRSAEHVDVEAIVALLDDYPDPADVIKAAIKKASRPKHTH